jgi:hypothetical protein
MRAIVAALAAVIGDASTHQDWRLSPAFCGVTALSAG